MKTVCNSDTMHLESYKEWMSMYNEDFKNIWNQEKGEFRKVSMIYCAFEKELDRLKGHLRDELAAIKSEFKKQEYLEKRKKFTGLVQSEKLDFDAIGFFNKENQTPDVVPLKEQNFNEIKTENFIIETPDTEVERIRTPSPQKRICDNNETVKSPVLRKNSFTKFKRKSSTSPLALNPASKISKIAKSESQKTPNPGDDSNIMESSIVENTPEVRLIRKGKRSRLKLKSTNKHKPKESKQSTTLTQMFFEPKEFKKEIDSDMPSMSITEMIKLINTSESEAESDETIDDLEVPDPSPEVKTSGPNYNRSTKGNDQPKFVYEEAVKGKERKNLKGWSCEECQGYYEALGLTPEELQKKKDQCSRHRFRFKPRDETFSGFWDLSFDPTPEMEDDDSLVFGYKK